MKLIYKDGVHVHDERGKYDVRRQCDQLVPELVSYDVCDCRLQHRAERAWKEQRTHSNHRPIPRTYQLRH